MNEFLRETVGTGYIQSDMPLKRQSQQKNILVRKKHINNTYNINFLDELMEVVKEGIAHVE
jgi:DNA-dependent RNA polymerase auxiliary subunit epsilon